MSRLVKLLAVAFAGLSIAPLHAIQDANGNGMSDVWESFYNGDQPFPLSSPYLPGDDPDGDGWSNAEEALAGTDPFSAALPAGRVRTTIEAHPEVEGMFQLSWPSIEGKAYRLSVSTNLADWADCGEIMFGHGGEIALALDCEYQQGGTPERLFWRVGIEDADPDGDGLTTWEELALGTDPDHPDSDRDGIFDNVDADPLASATLADPDGLGLPGSLETGLIGRWDFESSFFGSKSGAGGLPVTPRDGSWTPNEVAGGVPAKFSGLPDVQGMVSKAADNRSGQFALIDGNLLENHVGAFSVSFWAKFDSGEIEASTNPYYRSLWAVTERDNSSNIEGNALLVRKTGNEEEWYLGGYEWSGGGGQPDSLFTGQTVRFPAGTHDDGRWHHFAIIRDAGRWSLSIDGVEHLDFSGGWVPFDFHPLTDEPLDASTLMLLGRFQEESDLNELGASIDRLRVWSRALSAQGPDELTALWHQDIDHDGLWDITEARTSLWRDLNANAQRESGEFGFVSSPFEWQFSHRDSDGDGATDLEEQAAGTSVGLADSDGDLIPDGWELAHGLDPLDSSDGLLDPDGDGLSNLEEWRYHTNPNLANSDGNDPLHPDHTDDGAEVGQGSDPNDPTDGGQAPDAGELLPVLLGIGDESGSESEDYVMHCYRLDPESGEETRVCTLRSGGFGGYEEQTIDNVFRRGEAYSFQIHWQGSNLNSQAPDPGQGISAEGPDFDYTFKVEPQNLSTGEEAPGVIVDAWDPEYKTVDPFAGLLAENASNVAGDHSEFQSNYSRKRAVFYPLALHSNDRMLGGTLDLLPGFQQLELTIENESTGQNFGTHGYLDGSGDTLVYTSVHEIFGIEDNFGADVSDPSVWFLADPAIPSRREFYLISGGPDDDRGTVKVEVRLGGALLGTLRRTLGSNPVFEAAINGVTRWAEGDGFDMGGPAAGLPQAPQWAAPALIPLYAIGHQVEGTSLIIQGIGSGVKSGLHDDWEFIALVGQGTVLAGDFAHQAALAEITKWRDDPLARFVELHEMVYRAMEDQVFAPLGQVAEDLSTLEGFKRRFQNAASKGRQLTTNLWGSAVGGLEGWFDDFANRMADEAEAAAWLETPLSTNGLLAEGTALFREQCFTTGFVFGYLCEQVAVGAAGAGALKLAQVAAKGGVALASQLAKRTVATVAVRLHWYKKILADAGLQDALLRAAYERGFVLCAQEPAIASLKKPAFEILETLFTRQGFDRATYNFRRYLDDIENFPNLRKVTLTEGGEALISRRAAQLAHILGDDCDAVIMRNFMRIADEQICVLRPDGSVDDYFEAFFRAFNGNPSLMTSADDATFTITSLNANGKATLKKFLSDPDSGKLWEIDVPAIVDNEPAVPHNYWIRGVLGELDIYKRIYKPVGYSHAPTAAGYDFTGPKWVQIKTLKNPDGAIGAMEQAINKLVTESPGAPTPLKLHILKKPGTDSSGLDAALRQYLEDNSLDDRIELLIEAYELAP